MRALRSALLVALLLGGWSCHASRRATRPGTRLIEPSRDGTAWEVWRFRGPAEPRAPAPGAAPFLPAEMDDPLAEAEAALKALREAGDEQGRRRAADDLEKAVKELRERMKPADRTVPRKKEPLRQGRL